MNIAYLSSPVHTFHHCTDICVKNRVPDEDPMPVLDRTTHERPPVQYVRGQQSVVLRERSATPTRPSLKDASGVDRVNGVNVPAIAESTPGDVLVVTNEALAAKEEAVQCSGFGKEFTNLPPNPKLGEISNFLNNLELHDRQHDSSSCFYHVLCHSDLVQRGMEDLNQRTHQDSRIQFAMRERDC